MRERRRAHDWVTALPRVSFGLGHSPLLWDDVVSTTSRHFISERLTHGTVRTSSSDLAVSSNVKKKNTSPARESVTSAPKY